MKYMVIQGLANEMGMHSYIAYLHKFGKGRTKRRTVVQCHASPIYQGSINEPRTHHPPKVGRPSNNISLMNIHMAPSIGSRFQRRNVRPWDSLWLTYTRNAKYSISTSTSSSSYHVAVFLFSLAYRWFLMRKGCSCKFLLVSLQQYIPRLWKKSIKNMCVFDFMTPKQVSELIYWLLLSGEWLSKIPPLSRKRCCCVQFITGSWTVLYTSYFLPFPKTRSKTNHSHGGSFWRMSLSQV